MRALTTPAKLGGYALILLVVLAGGFGLGRAIGDDGDGRQAPAPHRPATPAPATEHGRHPQQTEEQS
ncbi:hypothetical protein [Streptomyces sp. NPDC048248]|uniref:hypothetical protein n=1 Tax=Streptomyces sp. NPDC048248 TaxID=3365523 RepID=UPI00371697E0